MQKRTDFPGLLTSFFTKYLPGQRGVGSNTVKAYRDTFVLLFRYLKDEKGIRPEKLHMEQLNADLVEGFLDWLEKERGNAVSTRNSRLAGIHAFIKYTASKKPDLISISRGVLDIKAKKTDSKPPVYLSIEEMQFILSKPDTKSSKGVRDLALLSVLYDSGARVQELIDATWHDLRLESPATLMLTGKGNKSRIIPLMPDTARIISSYKKTIKTVIPEAPIFTNQMGEKLTRSGVEYIIEKYACIAGEGMPSIKRKKITPHVYRHSKGMHLTQADVNIIYIRDLLGHSSVQVTERYARADSRSKREALEKASKNILPESVYTDEQENELLEFLKSFI